MDLLAPCRSCLQCLPFFQVSSSSPPRPATTTTTTTTATTTNTTTGPSSSSPPETASTASTTLDSGRGEYTQTSADAALQRQDLLTPGEEEEPPAPLHSSVGIGSNLQDSVISENEAQPMSEIIIAPAVSSPSSIPGASTYEEDADIIKTTTASQFPLHVPFINDISFSTSGLMPLPSPMTPAPFGAGYPAGQYHPSPHIYPPPNDDSHASNDPSQTGDDNSHVEHVDLHDNSHVEHVDSHDGQHGHYNSHVQHVDLLDNSHVDSHDVHSPSYHDHDNLHQGHSSSHHGHWHTHHGHGPPDESHAHDVPYATHDTSPVALETSNSTPGYLDTEGKQDGGNGTTGATVGDSAFIETYHSEPMILSGIPEDDDSYIPEEGLGHSTSQPGRRRRRRDQFKEQFKGIRQQIKQGGHQFKEDGSKHLQTIISNINKQAPQIEQLGSFYTVSRSNNN